MERLNSLIVKFVEQMPKEKEHGVLYVSEKHELSIHLCACGCGGQTVLPFRRQFAGKEKGWTHENNNGEFTIRPSIGNWSGENPYHAHYYITKNKIEWL